MSENKDIEMKDEEKQKEEKKEEVKEPLDPFYGKIVKTSNSYRV